MCYLIVQCIIEWLRNWVLNLFIPLDGLYVADIILCLSIYIVIKESMEQLCKAGWSFLNAIVRQAATDSNQQLAW